MAVGAGTLPAVRMLAGGRDHSLALTNTGTVWAWGSNAFGQIGDGTTTRRLRPVQVPGLTDVVAITAGREHSFAVKSDGTRLGLGLQRLRTARRRDEDKPHPPRTNHHLERGHRRQGGRAPQPGPAVGRNRRGVGSQLPRRGR